MIEEVEGVFGLDRLIGYEITKIKSQITNKLQVKNDKIQNVLSFGFKY